MMKFCICLLMICSLVGYAGASENPYDDDSDSFVDHVAVYAAQIKLNLIAQKAASEIKAAWILTQDPFDKKSEVPAPTYVRDGGGCSGVSYTPVSYGGGCSGSVSYSPVSYSYSYSPVRYSTPSYAAPSYAAPAGYTMVCGPNGCTMVSTAGSGSGSCGICASGMCSTGACANGACLSGACFIRR
jgi:hypothetical protein